MVLKAVAGLLNLTNLILHELLSFLYPSVCFPITILERFGICNSFLERTLGDLSNLELSQLSDKC